MRTPVPWNMARLLALFLVLVLSLPCLADDHDAVDEDQEPSVQSQDSTADPSPPFLSFLDAPQKTISSGLATMTSAMDEFFAEERVFYEETGSYLRLTLDAIQEEGGETGYAGDLKLKLRLPRTQEKLKLTFESSPEDERDDVDRPLEETPTRAAEEKEYFAGIQAVLGKPKKWRFSPGIGLKVRNPPELFARLRADRTYRTGNWLFRPSQTFYTFSEKGFISDTQFEFDYKIADRILFRATSLVRYTNENDYHEPSQVLSLIHAISDRRGMVYQIGAYGISEPTLHATDYLAQIRFRQRVHSNYLFLELIPKVIYRRENDFESEHFLTFRIEMSFRG